MNIALQERDQQVSHMAAELRQLWAGLAHKVRNPLNGMRLFLGLLKRQIPADPKTEQLIEQVDGEVQLLNQLVSEFLDFARPTPLQTEAVDLSDVVSSVLVLLDAELQAGTIEVQTINLATLPPIEADADQLKWNPSWSSRFGAEFRNKYFPNSKGSTYSSVRVAGGLRRQISATADVSAGYQIRAYRGVIDPRIIASDLNTYVGGIHQTASFGFEAWPWGGCC